MLKQENNQVSDTCSQRLKKKLEDWLIGKERFKELGTSMILKLSEISIDQNIENSDEILKIWRKNLDQNEDNVLKRFEQEQLSKKEEKRQNIESQVKQCEKIYKKMSEDSFHFDSDSYSKESSYDDVDDEFRDQYEKQCKQSSFPQKNDEN